MWAMKAYNHAEVYFNVSIIAWACFGWKVSLKFSHFSFFPPFSPKLISSVDPKFLKLTKSDDKIYSAFMESFGDLNLEVLDPELLKSPEAKEVLPITIFF